MGKANQDQKTCIHHKNSVSSHTEWSTHDLPSLKSFKFHWAISSATPKASTKQRKSLWWTSNMLKRSALPSYNGITAACPCLSPLAPDSCTLPHCVTCSKNPQLLCSCWKKCCKSLRTRQHPANETCSRQHLVLLHGKAICRQRRTGAFLVLKGSQLLFPA